MSCAEVRPILPFLIEKEADPLETLEARRHLDSCRACRLRADRVSSVMTACADLRDQQPPVDVASGVMERLRGLKAAAAGGRIWAPPAAKWSGLAVLAGAGLALLARPAAPVLRTLGAPLALLAGLLAGADAPDGTSDVAGHAVTVALRFVGVAVKPELTSGAGIDLVVTFQLLATALTIGFLLVIPVAILTAWFLHYGSTRQRLPRL